MTYGLHALVAGCALTMALAMVPADASAQGRRGGGRVAQPRDAVVARRPIVVRSYRPAYYGSLFYGPWYSPWYSPYYGGFGGYGSYPFAPPFFGGVVDTTASVRIQVTPREAEVFVDGYFAGVVDNFDGTFQRLRLEPGEHTLQLFHPGYRPVSRPLYLQPGVTTRVREAMAPLGPGDQPAARPQGGPRPVPRSAEPTRQARRVPAPSPSEDAEPDVRDDVERSSGFGELALRVQPSDADILVDGERWEGTAPDGRLLIQLGTGTHHIEIRKNGYRTYLSDVNIRDGQSRPVNVALTPQ